MNPTQPVVRSHLPLEPLQNYNIPPQSDSFVHATMAGQALSSDLETSPENSQPPKEAANGPMQPINLQQPIKISPPSQFDHSRPFVFNGQLVYPVPAGFQPPPNSVPLPITVLGDPNLPHQVSTTGGFLPPPYPMPIPMPLMVPPGSVGHLPLMFPNGVHHVEGGLPLARYIPQFAQGLIPLSELLKSQIQGLRNQVKHIDDQLANNRHQVDEYFLQRQRGELIVFIEKIEAMLHAQVSQEANHASVPHLNGSAGENTTTSTGGSSTKSLTKANISGATESNKLNLSRSSITSNEGLKKNSTTYPQAMTPPVPLFVPTPQQPAKQIKSETVQVTKTTFDSKPSIRSEPPTKSRLTVAAAKAPPFQPRARAIADYSELGPVSDITIQALNNVVTLSNPLLSLRTPGFGPLGNRYSGNSSTDWCKSMPHLGVDHASLFQAHTIQTPQILDGNHSAHLQPSYTFHTSLPACEPASKPGGAIFSSRPYLIGTLPNGVHLSEASGSDFIYSRPLTEDEIRARHLYWGDAPRSALKGSGLPKFDGKDFYPPSPVKGLVTVAATSKAHSSSTTTTLPSFETPLTNLDVCSYHTPPQICTKSSEQNHIPTPTRAFLENDIIGFQSPSPRPATYTFDHRLPQDWSSTQYGNNAESTHKKMTQPAATQVPTPVSEDFSNLFTSPTALHPSHSNQSFRGSDAQPAIPQNTTLSNLAEGKDDEHESLNSWGASKNIGAWEPGDLEDVKSTETNTIDLQSNASTVEIRLISEDTTQSPKCTPAATLVERQVSSYR
jgi:hypothetical protein